MANSNAPFGLRPVGKIGSEAINMGTSKYEIASGESDEKIYIRALYFSHSAHFKGDALTGVHTFLVRYRSPSRKEWVCLTGPVSSTNSSRSGNRYGLVSAHCRSLDAVPA